MLRNLCFAEQVCIDERWTSLPARITNQNETCATMPDGKNDFLSQNFVSHIFEQLFSCQDVHKSTSVCACPCAQSRKVMTVQNPKPREPPNRKSKEEQRREIMQINRILNMSRHTTADLIENQAYAVPSWEKEPDPLDGWTLEDQRLLIAADKELRKNRLAMLDLGLPEEKVLWEHLRQIARRVPGKNVAAASSTSNERASPTLVDKAVHFLLMTAATPHAGMGRTLYETKRLQKINISSCRRKEF